jgi:hypothetical protein
MSLELAIILAFLWIVGVITSYSLAGFIVIFLVLAVIAVVISTRSHDAPTSHHSL